ncbi:MAG: hypothetical protein RLZZ387_4502, partial [Chloroflexota bacterium]
APKKEAEVVIESDTLPYDRNLKSLVVTTDPPDLALQVSFEGINGTVYPKTTAPPINAGTYKVEATVVDEFYGGTGTAEMTVTKAPAVVTLDQLFHTYDGTSKTAIASTSPLGLVVRLTYTGISGTTYETPELPPTAPGNYSVVAAVDDLNYSGAMTTTMVIAKARASIALSNLNQVAANARDILIVTNPPSVTTSLTYTGLSGTEYPSSSSFPNKAGTYLVHAEAAHPFYQGMMTGTLTLMRGEQQITFKQPEPVEYNPDNNNIQLTATTNAISPIEIQYTTSSPSTVCEVSARGNVTVSGPGECVVTASHPGDENWLPAAPITRVQLITLGDIAFPSEIAADTDTISYNDRQFSVSASVKSGPPISFSSRTPLVCQITGPTSEYIDADSDYEREYTTVITILRASECRIAATQLGSGSYPSRSKEKVVAIAKGTQQLIWDVPATALVSDTVAINISATSGLRVNLTIADVSTDYCSLTSSTRPYVTIKKKGNVCKIQANVEESENYEAIDEELNQISIGGIPQSISIDPPPLATLMYSSGGTFAVTGRTSSGLPLIFSTDTDGVCTIPPDTEGLSAIVTVEAPGDCIIRAQHPGNDIYSAARDAVLTVKIVKAPQTFIFPTLPNRPYGAPTFTLPTRASSGRNVTIESESQQVCTVNTMGTVSLVGIGLCSLVATEQGDTYYEPLSLVRASFDVLKGTQTITFDPIADRRLGSSAFAPTVTATSGLTVTLTANGACEISNNTVTLSRVGSCSLTASQSGNDSWYEAPPVTRAFSVLPEEVTVVLIPPTNPVYNGSPQPISFATDPSGRTDVEVLYNGSLTPPVSAGTYYLTARLTSPSAVAVISGTTTMTIAKRDATIFLATPSVTSDGLPKTGSITTFPSGLAVTVTYTDTLGNVLSTPPTDPGTYTVTAQVVDVNFKGEKTVTLTIVAPTAIPTATSTPTNTPTATSTPTNTPAAISTPTNTPAAISTPTDTPASPPTNTPTP